MSEEYQKITIPDYVEYQKLKEENARLREALELIEESCEFCGFEYARKALEKGE